MPKPPASTPRNRWSGLAENFNMLAYANEYEVHTSQRHRRRRQRQRQRRRRPSVSHLKALTARRVFCTCAHVCVCVRLCHRLFAGVSVKSEVIERAYAPTKSRRAASVGLNVILMRRKRNLHSVQHIKAAAHTHTHTHGIYEHFTV